jgi:endonuclease YncB( thermonuclease family)
MAWVYDRYVKGYEHLYPLQEAARQARIGLWSMEAVPPWEWRRLPTRNAEFLRRDTIKSLPRTST